MSESESLSLADVLTMLPPDTVVDGFERRAIKRAYNIWVVQNTPGHEALQDMRHMRRLERCHRD